mgnify:FL=1
MTRDELDRYYTPPWVIDALVTRLRSYLFPRSGVILEPCCGDGRLADALRAHGWQVVTGDIDPDVEADHHWDFVEAAALGRVPQVDAVVTNPPYRDVTRHVEAALSVSPFVALLMPLSWLEPCADRAQIWLERPPSYVLVLPRPSFTGDGKTDPRTVAWYVWNRGGHRVARIEHVDPAIRKAWRDRQAGQGELI